MAGAPRIDPDELKRRMDAGEDLVVLDVRRGSWHRSDVKIKGAIRAEPVDVIHGDGTFAREQAIVTYCT